MLGKTLGKWGKVIKTRKGEEVVLERKHVTRTYTLRYNAEKCIGCAICTRACPKEAVKFIPASTSKGRIIKKASVDFEVDLCIFCGICEVLCPSGALQVAQNGEEAISVVEKQVFPLLLKDIKIAKEKCDLKCDFKCEKDCPSECIKVIRNSSSIVDVRIDKSRCLYCGQCELSCPLGAVKVLKPFDGSIELSLELCPDDCRICVDLCPTHAIKLSEHGTISLFEDVCIYCSACQGSCPKGAVKVNIYRVAHTDVKSGTWWNVLKKLTSYEAALRELALKSRKKAKQKLSAQMEM